MNKMRNILIYMNRQCRGDFDEMFTKIKTKERFNPEKVQKGAEKTISDMESQGYKVITILDDNYPTILKKMMYRVPMVIYAKGELGLLNCKGIGIIGDDELFEEKEDLSGGVLVFLGTEEIEIINTITNQRLFIRLTHCDVPTRVDLVDLFCAYCNAVVSYYAEGTDEEVYILQSASQQCSVIKVVTEGTEDRILSLLCSDVVFTGIRDLVEEVSLQQEEF